jgi:mono/diheme cytochrome c family protein
MPMSRFALAAGLCLVPLLAVPSQAADLAAGQRIFETVCATCHGATGKPDPSNPVVQAFDPQPADLSDPLFNSREPSSPTSRRSPTPVTTRPVR